MGGPLRLSLDSYLPKRCQVERCLSIMNTAKLLYTPAHLSHIAQTTDVLFVALRYP